MTGAGRRKKGHDFERLVANRYRERWPDRVVRRGNQSHKAFEPDVVIEGSTLWSECQCAAKPTPLAKLAQAERDCPEQPIVVVWRKTGAKTINATMRLGTLLELNGMGHMLRAADQVVTLDFDEWIFHVNPDIS